MLRDVGIGAGEQDHVVGDVGHRGPHLRPVDHPFVAVLDRLGGGRCHVGAGLRLGVAERRECLSVEQRRHDRLLEMVAAVFHQDRGGDDRDAHRVDRRPGQLHFFVEHDRLERSATTTAELFRHGAGEPALGCQRSMQLRNVHGAVVGDVEHRFVEVLGEERLHLGAEGLNLGRETEVHQAAPFTGPNSASARRAYSAAGSPSWRIHAVA